MNKQSDQCSNKYDNGNNDDHDKSSNKDNNRNSKNDDDKSNNNNAPAVSYQTFTSLQSSRLYQLTNVLCICICIPF